MKLINKTSYPTAELRAVLIAVHAEEAKRRGRLLTWNLLTVTVVRGRRRHTTGYAYYSGRVARLRLPVGVVAIESVVAVWLHELQHLYGIKHPDMAPAVRRCAWRDGTLAPWTAVAIGALARLRGHDAGQGLIEVAPAPKSTADRVAKREAAKKERRARVLSRIAAWEAKLRRAERALAKLRKQERYYERAAAGRT